MLFVVLPLSLTIGVGVISGAYPPSKDRDGAVTLLLCLVLFIVQPVLLAICAGKIYGRSGTIWPFLAFLMNVGILVFFESQLPSRSVADRADEVETIMIISAMFFLVSLELLRNGPPATAEKAFLRRGLFRILVVISGGWIILCSAQFMYLPPYTCYYHCGFFARAFFGAGSHDPNYLDVGKAFVGIPALAFVLGRAACWVVEGFRRSTPT